MKALPAPLVALALLSACGSNVPPAGSNAAAGHGGAMPGMAMPAPTGNQDRDFARMMIVHHQGAIDMARKQIAQGSDARLREMAREIIAAQEREISELNAFLDRTGGR